jgi:hypothetical protein
MNRNKVLQIISGVFLGIAFLTTSLGVLCYFLWVKFTITPTKPIFAEEMNKLTNSTSAPSVMSSSSPSPQASNSPNNLAKTKHPVNSETSSDSTPSSVRKTENIDVETKKRKNTLPNSQEGTSPSNVIKDNSFQQKKENQTTEPTISPSSGKTRSKDANEEEIPKEANPSPSN